jgi:hypothetical protein
MGRGGAVKPAVNTMLRSMGQEALMTPITGDYWYDPDRWAHEHRQTVSSPGEALTGAAPYAGLSMLGQPLKTTLNAPVWGVRNVPKMIMQGLAERKKRLGHSW